jgi:hypothetical protein
VPVHDGPALLSAWAATTPPIRIGLLIENVVVRRPTVLAKQAVTIFPGAASEHNGTPWRRLGEFSGSAKITTACNARYAESRSLTGR